MVISNRFILHQGPVIAGLFRTVAQAVKQGKKPLTKTLSTPTPEIVQELPPRAKDLVSTYVRHVGGEPSASAPTGSARTPMVLPLST